MGYKSSYQLTISSQNGNAIDFDLTEAGNVYGGLDKCRTDSGDCDIKTAEIANEGFEGVYGVPRTIQKALRRRRMLGHEVHDEIMDHVEERRRLQTQNPNAKIFNPIYCIKENDSFGKQDFEALRLKGVIRFEECRTRHRSTLLAEHFVYVHNFDSQWIPH